jgi:hypothetical protein
MCDGVGLGLRSAHVELVVMDPGGEGFNSIDTVRELLQWYDHVVRIRERHVSARARMEELILKHDSKN